MMAMTGNLQFTLSVFALLIFNTKASPFATLLTDPNEKSDPLLAPLDDEDKDFFSGDSFANPNKGVEEVVLYVPEENESMNFKSMNVQDYFDQDEQSPAGLQAEYESYGDSSYGAYGFTDTCEVLRALGIHCVVTTTEAEDTTTAASNAETSTDTTEEQTSTTTTTTTPSQVQVTTNPTTTIAATENRQLVPDVDSKKSTSTTTTSTAVEITEEDKSDRAVTEITQNPQEDDEFTTTRKEDTKDRYPGVFVPPITAVVSETEDKLTSSPKLHKIQSTTESTEEKVQGAETSVETPIQKTLPPVVEHPKSESTTVQSITADVVGEEDKTDMEDTDQPMKTTSSLATKLGSATTPGKSDRGDESTETVATVKLTKATTTVRAMAMTSTAMTTTSTTTAVGPEESDDVIATSPSAETLKPFGDTNTTTTPPVEREKVTPPESETDTRDEFDVGEPTTQAIGDEDQRFTTENADDGFDLKRPSSAPDDDKHFTEDEFDVGQPTNKPKSDEHPGVATEATEDEFDVEKPTAESKSGGHQVVTPETARPNKAEFSTIVLIICIVALLLVLILVAVIVLIIRARFKRRGKYAITSEVDTTEGGAGGQAGDVASASPAKVVTVQYNDSNA